MFVFPSSAFITIHKRPQKLKSKLMKKIIFFRRIRIDIKLDPKIVGVYT